jgi:glycosyltransferase involved in cell wall biosynthesis
MRLTVSMPCFGRPERTIRAINSIANQSINGWEALVIGDGCPVMQDFIDSDYFQDIIKMCSFYGNDLIIENNPINKGGHGFAITNNNIQIASGKYFTFFANDDIILPNHFENYLSQIEGTDLDFVYFNSIVAPINSLRSSSLQYGTIGHSELIVRTEFLKQMPIHNEHYGHDWELIKAMSEIGKYKKAENCPPTYYVMSLSDKREQGID